MADEKKPKIDLKTRLQKMGAGGNLPQPAAGGPSGIPLPGKSVPGLSSGPPSVPVPPGIPMPPTSGGLDPSNPLAAVAVPFRPSAAPASAPVQPQRIEVDEGAIRQARGSVRKQMLALTVVVAAALGGLGYLAGGASEQSKTRAAAKADMKSLASDVTKAKEQLDSLADKLSDGAKALKQQKYPDALSGELAKINIDFDGTKLEGRKFSGMRGDTGKQLFEFITAVSQMNDKKKHVANRLDAMKKPISEQFALPKDAGAAIAWAVVFDANTVGGGAPLIPFAKPFIPTPKANQLPEKISLKKTAEKNEDVIRFTGGAGTKLPEKDSLAIPILPGSFDKACPSEAAGKNVKALRGELLGLKNEVKADEVPDEDAALEEQKLDLVKRAEKLIASLSEDAR